MRSYRTSHGYYLTWVDGRHCRAHRHVWVECFGEIPPRMVVMHTCDNPACVNPEHLRLGTQRENCLDKARKGRNPGVRKLSLRDAGKIKRRLAQGAGQHQLAREFGVKQTTIRAIAVGATWRHA